MWWFFIPSTCIMRPGFCSECSKPQVMDLHQAVASCKRVDKQTPTLFSLRSTRVPYCPEAQQYQPQSSCLQIFLPPDISHPPVIKEMTTIKSDSTLSMHHSVFKCQVYWTKVWTHDWIYVSHDLKTFDLKTYGPNAWIYFWTVVYLQFIFVCKINFFLRKLKD